MKGETQLTLNSEYDDQEVAAFMQKFDTLNVRRIEQGLHLASEQLEAVPAGARGIGALDVKAVHSVFEALNCKPFLSSEEELELHFSQFFRLLQTNKSLKLGSYSPAMTWFLFGNDKERVKWATKEWVRLKRNLLAAEFENCVQDPLLLAMTRIQLDCLDKDFLLPFWEGTSLLIKKMDKEIITHSLRAMEGRGMEADVCMLAYSHLQIDSDAFVPLLVSVRHILETSPTDFWEALGTISPSAWLDQFFASPALGRLMQQEAVDVEELLAWIPPFIRSIKSINQPPTTRTVVTRLLGKFGNDGSISIATNSRISVTALKVLVTTLRNLNAISLSDLGHVAGPMALDILDLTEEHIRALAQFARRTSREPDIGTDLIYQAIVLDCKCFLARSKAPVKESDMYPRWKMHMSIWKQASTCLTFGNVALAKRMLSAFKPLGASEPYVTKLSKLPTTQSNFNETLLGLKSPICDALDRIGEFGRTDIEVLFDDIESAYSTVLLLFNSDGEVRSAAVELLKALSDQNTRRDALGFLLRKHYEVTLRAFSLALRQIEEAKCFIPSFNTLRILSDIMEILCNQQDGLLRSETLSPEGCKATYSFWGSMWKLLRTMFSTTETWSQKGHDKTVLMDFCRDAMDFADKAFDQFGVLRNALNPDQIQAEDSELGKKLLASPKNATGAIVAWLKLRDDFLVAKSCALVCKLLIRLKEFDEQLEDESRLNFVLEIIIGTLKSTLTGQQKAELSRALEKHAGIKIDNDENQKSKPQRNSVIDLDKWTSNARRPKTDEEIDDVIATVAPSYHKLKQEQELKKLPTRPSVTPTTVPGPKSIISQSISVSEFKRKREQEMQEKKRRDALAAANLKKRLGSKPLTVGVGSGARGIGVVGKEHTVAEKGEGMMVSSEEDESDDEELTELDRELFGSSKRSANTSKGLTKEQIKAIQQQRSGPVKKQRRQRSTRDMRARLAPDLSPLHKDLLSWEYFHNGNFPPNSNASNYAAVLNNFRDVSEYQRTFHPLLILEAWNGFVKAREENASRPYDIKVVLRSSVDAFLEVSTTMSHNDAKEISEGDVVLLSKSKSPVSAPDEPHCLSRVWRITRKKAHLEVTYRALPGTTIAPSLSTNSTIYGIKVMSIVPLEREYGALLGLQYYDLCDEIMVAKPSPLLKYSDEVLQPFMTNYSINKAQAKAIKSALDNDAFTLIQGPPGSGKTKTIVAISGALLSDALKSEGVAIDRPKQTNQSGVPNGPAKKLLVCAPSNAAVDELVMRFKEGVRTVTGEYRKVSVVRLGRTDAVNANVQDVTLEELVNKKLNVTPAFTNTTSGETQKIMMEHKDISEQLRQIREEVDVAEAKGGVPKGMKEKFDALRRKKALLGAQVDAAKDNEGIQNRQAEINRKRAQQQVLDGAHVICATLSGSGHDMFQNLNIEFETVIIDEAAQCVELSALIPLKYGCAKCILVGDPQQLPPTVFSKDAARFKYEQSLFVRMQANHPADVHLLDTQYRMHPEISAFPSEAFYESRLLDGPDMASKRARPWHGTELLSPYRFFDVQGQHQSAPKGHSLVNLAEIRIAVQLYRRLTSDFRGYDFKGKIGIITPYKSQLRQLKDDFRMKFGHDILDTIEFNTTDAFQGRESEIIIFSCVRASPAGGIGFLQDIRRMNVGLTRAKSSLWVLGNSQSLAKGEFWEKLISHSKSSGRFTDGDLAGLLGTQSRMISRIEDGSRFDQAPRKLPGIGARMTVDDQMDVDVKSMPTARPKISHTDLAVRKNSSNEVPTVEKSKPQNPPRVATGSNSSLRASVPLSNAALFPSGSIPAKRKIPGDAPPRRNKVQSSDSSSMSSSDSDSDVEMADAPPSKKAKHDPSPATSTTVGYQKTSAADGRQSNGQPKRVGKSGEAQGAGSSRPLVHAANPSVSTVPRPPGTSAPKKKKEVSVFIKKKPRR